MVNAEAIRAAQIHLEKHRPVRTAPFNTSLIELLDHVLILNNFQFNGENYLQIGGTAMGTKVAPSLANIFMSDFEEKYIYTYPLQPLFWARYIDDIICIWQHGPMELAKFNEHLNSCHDSIKFSHETSTEHIHFLDITIHLNERNELWTDLYCKPTDSHNYLHYKSAHPSHCKNSLPYSQFLRLRRICSNMDDFIKHSGMISYHFLRRGYPLKTIQSAFERTLCTDRQTLLNLKPTDETSNDNLVLVTNFIPKQPILSKIVHLNWDILSRSSTTKSLAEKRVVTTYRKPQSLRDILVRAKLPKQKTPRDKPCSETVNSCTRKCRYCPLLNKTGSITSTRTNWTYKCKMNITCKSSNLIYCIQCNICQKQYVGQTMNTIQQRFQCHFEDIQKNKTEKDIGRHYNSNGHSGTKDMSIYVLDFIYEHPRTRLALELRNVIEHHWIQRLRTQLPWGLNTMDKSPTLTTFCRHWQGATH